MPARNSQLDAWIREWTSICDQALDKIRQGESDAGQFVEDAVRSSDVLPDIAKDALATVVRFILQLGEGALEEGLVLARESGILGLRLRALFS